MLPVQDARQSAARRYLQTARHAGMKARVFISVPTFRARAGTSRRNETRTINGSANISARRVAAAFNNNKRAGRVDRPDRLGVIDRISANKGRAFRALGRTEKA